MFDVRSEIPKLELDWVLSSRDYIKLPDKTKQKRVCVKSTLGIV